MLAENNIWWIFRVLISKMKYLIIWTDISKNNFRKEGKKLNMMKEIKFTMISFHVLSSWKCFPQEVNYIDVY